MQRCAFPAALRHRLAASSAHRRLAPLLLHASLSRTASRQRGPQLGTHGDILRRPRGIPEDEWNTYARSKRYRLSHVSRIEDTEHGTVAPRPCKRCAEAGETCMVYTLEGQKWSQSSSCARCRRLARPCTHNDQAVVGWYRDAMRRWASDGRLTHHQRISDLYAKNKELVAEVGSLRMDAAATKAMREETINLHAERRNAEAGMSSLRKENEKLQARLRNVQDKIEARRAGSTSNDPSLQETGIALRPASIMPRKLRTTANAENRATRRENEVLNAQLRTIARQLEAERLGLSLDDAAVQGAEKLSRAATIKLRRLRSELRGNLSASKSAQIKGRMKRMEQEVQDMRQTAAECQPEQASHQELLREKAALRQQIDPLKTTRKRSNLEHAVEAHRAELDEVQAARERQLMQQISKLQEDLDEARRSQGQPDAGVAAESVESDNAEPTEERLLPQRRDDSARLKAQLAEATIKKREFDRVKKENEAAVAANVDLEAQLQALTSRLENVRATKAQSPSAEDLASQLRATEAETRRLRQTVDSLKDLGKQNEALRRKVFALRKPSDPAREQHQSSKSVIAAANEQRR